jgi:hypothetical protein
MTKNENNTFHQTRLKIKIGTKIQNKKYSILETNNFVQFTNGFGNLP